MRATLLVVAVPVLAACVPLDPSVFLDKVAAEALRLEVGQCVDEPALSHDEAGEVGLLAQVDCDGPHDAEVYYVEDVDGTTLPDGLADISDEVCYQAYEAFAGVPYEDSSYYYTALYPTADTWAIGDRQIACVITGDEGERLEGSLAGVGR